MEECPCIPVLQKTGVKVDQQTISLPLYPGVHYAFCSVSLGATRTTLIYSHGSHLSHTARHQTEFVTFTPARQQNQPPSVWSSNANYWLTKAEYFHVSRTAVYTTAGRQRSYINSRNSAVRLPPLSLITPAWTFWALAPNIKLTAQVWYLNVTCRRHTAEIELHACEDVSGTTRARGGARRLLEEGDAFTVRDKSHLEAEPAVNAQGNVNRHAFDNSNNPHMS